MQRQQPVSRYTPHRDDSVGRNLYYAVKILVSSYYWLVVTFFISQISKFLFSRKLLSSCNHGRQLDSSMSLHDALSRSCPTPSLVLTLGW